MEKEFIVRIISKKVKTMNQLRDLIAEQWIPWEIEGLTVSEFKPEKWKKIK